MPCWVYQSNFKKMQRVLWPEWTPQTQQPPWIVHGHVAFVHWFLVPIATLPIAEGCKIGFHPTAWHQNEKTGLVSSSVLGHTNQVFYLAWGWSEDCWCKAISKISCLEGSLQHINNASSNARGTLCWQGASVSRSRGPLVGMRCFPLHITYTLPCAL